MVKFTSFISLMICYFFLTFKLSNASVIDTRMENTDESNDIRSTILRSPRVKRQYFKPQIDGNKVEIRAFYATKNNQIKTVNNLDENNKVNKTSEEKSNLKILKWKKNSNAQNSSSEQQNPMTITSLGLSLINLFDRIKGTLCDMIRYDCSKLQSNVL